MLSVGMLAGSVASVIIPKSKFFGSIYFGGFFMTYAFFISALLRKYGQENIHSYFEIDSSSKKFADEY